MANQWFFIFKFIWNNVHNCWLAMVVDFNDTKQYRWGLVVLAYLYRGMCEATNPKFVCLAGCNFLLQVWGYSRLDYLAPKNIKELSFPFGTK